MGDEKPKLELIKVAEALLKVTIHTPPDEIDELIREGYLHLSELRSAVHCNPLQTTSLMYRLDHAEEVRERQKWRK